MNDLPNLDHLPSPYDKIREAIGAYAAKVLLIDDDIGFANAFRVNFSEFFEKKLIALEHSESIKAATKKLTEQSYDVILLDKDLGDKNGIQNIPSILDLCPNTVILVQTGSSDVNDCVEAMRNGAFGFMIKSHSIAVRQEQISNALKYAATLKRKTLLEKGDSSTTEFKEQSFNSPVMKRLILKVRAVSESERPVLFLGESGVGKTTIARALHEYRKKLFKRSGPFFHVNLTALPESLIERELFGNEKSAYTGASRRQLGYFESANGGTLFLDEIGDIPPSLQVKLLTAIETGKFTRVGGTTEIHSKFKLICATNKNLEQLVEENKFREDLYARISTFPITIPSLRDRQEDIPAIIESIVPIAASQAHVPFTYKDIPADFVEALTNEPPRLNIRGVEICLAQLFTLSRRDSKGIPILKKWKQIDELKHLTKLSTDKDADYNNLVFSELLKESIQLDSTLQLALEKLEKKLIIAAIKQSTSIRNAAEKLGISSSLIHYKINRYGVNSKKINKSKEISL